jgi:glycyl-tRNA synthetase
MRTKLPFSIGQIGKAFRNEITPGKFTFRTIEFEQMEYQTFCKQENDESLYRYFKDYGIEFFEFIGLSREHLQFRDHEKLAHYAKAACDIEYLFPFGWGEINGTHNRTDFDLKRHQEFSGKSMVYFDAETNERYIPYVIESTYGLDRLVLAVLFEGLKEEELEDGDTRQVLKIKPSLAPVKVNVLPLIKKRHTEKAQIIYNELKKYLMVSYDDAGNIGKRYRRGDAIGTPFAVTIDDTTLEKNTVTVRERDTMQQITVKVEELKNYMIDNIQFSE